MARAEAGWCADDVEAAARGLVPLETFATDQFNDWELAEADWWRPTLGIDVPARDGVPEPFARMAAGDWVGAAATWEGLGCSWWQGVCLSQAESVDDARVGTELLAATGAVEIRAASTITSPRGCASSPSRTGPRPPPPRDSAGSSPPWGTLPMCSPDPLPFP